MRQDLIAALQARYGSHMQIDGDVLTVNGYKLHLEAMLLKKHTDVIMDTINQRLRNEEEMARKFSESGVDRL